jgi:hypothetical protein
MALPLWKITALPGTSPTPEPVWFPAHQGGLGAGPGILDLGVRFIHVHGPLLVIR